ncbi:hypothetical protein K439DRAFT_1632789, partial [Ramaria rubella]
MLVTRPCNTAALSVVARMLRACLPEIRLFVRFLLLLRNGDNSTKVAIGGVQFRPNSDGVKVNGQKLASRRWEGKSQESW